MVTKHMKHERKKNLHGSGIVVFRFNCFFYLSTFYVVHDIPNNHYMKFNISVNITLIQFSRYNMFENVPNVRTSDKRSV